MNKRLLISSFIFAFLFFSQIHASEIAEKETDSSKEEKSIKKLESIIVTARKRAESIDEVPASISVISESKLEKSNKKTLSEISSFIPNFSVAENAVNTIITMRGVSIGANQSFEQSVGVFIDGVHYPKSRQLRSALFDLSGIEVLRGPQGSLFGKNTLAGAVILTTKNPELGKDSVSGTIDVTFQSDKNQGQEYSGAFNIPLSDKIAVRLAAQKSDYDGYIKNIYRNTSSPSVDELIARPTLLFKPTDQLEILIKHTHSRHKREGSSAVPYHYGKDSPAAANLLAFATIDMLYPQFQRIAKGGQDESAVDLGYGSQNGYDLSIGLNPTGTDTISNNTSIQSTFEFKNGIELKTILGQTNYHFVDNIDADFTPMSFIARDDDSSYEKSSIEVRLTGQTTDFEWILGGYYDTHQQEIDRNVMVDGTFGGQILGVTQTLVASPGSGLTAMPSIFVIPNPMDPSSPIIYNRIWRVSNWKQTGHSSAIFGQLNYNLTDSIELVAGLRILNEQKNIYADVCVGGDTPTDVDVDKNSCPGAFSGADPYLQPNPFIAGLQESLFQSYAHRFDSVDPKKEDKLLPSFQIQNTFNDSHMAYISYSTGYKSGGFNSVDDQNPAFSLESGKAVPLRTVPGIGFEYEPESSTSYEVGAKHSLFDSLQLNWSLSSSEYLNQQVSSFVGLGFVVTNAASTQSNALEIDALWIATEKLSLTLAAALLDAKYVNFNGAGCTSKQQAKFRDFATSKGKSLFEITQADFAGGSSSFDGCNAIFDATGIMTGQSQDLSGKTTGSPELTGSLGFAYVEPLKNVDLFTELDLNYIGENFTTGDLDPITKMDATFTLNLRIGFETEIWNAMLYSNNLTDTKIYTGAADVPLLSGSHFAYMAEGRVVGLKLGYKF